MARNASSIFYQLPKIEGQYFIHIHFCQITTFNAAAGHYIRLSEYDIDIFILSVYILVLKIIYRFYNRLLFI